MARSNDATAGNYMTATIPSTPAYPMTIAGWLNPSAFSDWFFLTVFNNSNPTRHHRLRVNATGSFSAFTRDGTANPQTTPIGPMTVGAYAFFAYVCVSPTERYCFLDATKSATSTTSSTPDLDLDRIYIGRETGISALMNGAIGEVGLWTIALSDADIAQLQANTLCPALVQKTSLLGYWKLLGTDSPEPDSIGSANATITGTMPQATHPSPIYYESLSIAATDAVKAEG